MSLDFAVVSAFVPIEELAPLATAADELGYASFALADHVVDLEQIETPYPYTADGNRRWSVGTHWPDPWVTIGSLATVTERIRFFTSIYVAALRSPYQVAKSVGTASIISGGRVSLGVGVGWCKEEFELLGEDFATRGRRTDEGLALMKQLWTPGSTTFEGEHYSTGPLVMEPTPAQQVPILIGGFSPVALRRACQYDGWIGDALTIEQTLDYAGQLYALRAERGLDGPYRIVAALMDAFLPEHFQRAADGGVDEVMTMPWMYYYGPKATLEQKLEGLHRFKADVMDQLT